MAHTITNRPQTFAFVHLLGQRAAAFAVLSLICIAATAQDSQSAVEAFIEPFKTIQIPATEVGTLTSIDVAEGEQVSQGQALARIDDRILQASLAAARAAMQSKGNLRAAQAEVDMKNRQLASLEELRARGNATQRELDRALADRELSDARLQAVREELEIRKFEYERIVVQIEKRVLQSPINGVVASIDKDAGEFVAPTDPIVMTIVQLDPVQAVFSLPITAARRVRLGDQVQLSVGVEDRHVKGVVDFVAPTADAKSGTMRVKMRIANPSGQILSGSTCRWEDIAITDDEFASSPSRKILMARTLKQNKNQ